ncbi:hypothetical protein FE634_14630 [Nocardioides dongxiaopingii]|uniref:hypothetical protein n=1 Tax=Nocardioides TaxID=1839 RepID=UPI0010C76198|nr:MULTISPECIES: hypothetical protein [Nocardioides]QCW51330.1 hypothetical protein FE634_14630 [Nocardioides sp. S-1144]
MKFEAIVKDLIEELHTSSSATTSSGAPGPSSAGSSRRSTDALVATGTELVMQVVAQVAESVGRVRAGSDPAADSQGAPDSEDATEPAPSRGTSEIEALVRRVVTQARDLASQDRAELVRQLSRPDLLLSGRGRAPQPADTVRGRVEL